jgi:hypothetical protein
MLGTNNEIVRVWVQRAPGQVLIPQRHIACRRAYGNVAQAKDLAYRTQPLAHQPGYLGHAAFDLAALAGQPFRAPPQATNYSNCDKTCFFTNVLTQNSNCG